MKAILLDEAKKWLEKNCENQYTRMAVFGIMQSMPTVDYQKTPNEPLTLEQLRKMGGKPVWLDVAGGMWALVDALDGCLWLDRGGSIDIAKFAGKVYRRQPEGEA